MIERWDLPQVIADVVAHHHQPDHATSNLTAVSLIHLADVAANRLGIGLMEPWSTPLHPFARKCLNWEQRDLDAEMQATKEDPKFQQELEWLVHL